MDNFIKEKILAFSIVIFIAIVGINGAIIRLPKLLIMALSNILVIVMFVTFILIIIDYTNSKK